MSKYEEKAYGLMIFLMFIALLTIFVPALQSQSLPQEDYHGKVDIHAINSGSMVLSGAVECRKYFDECLVKNYYTFGNLTSRDTVNVEQWVVIKTGITNPEIVGVEDKGNKKLTIHFVYKGDGHESWIPVLEE